MAWRPRYATAAGWRAAPSFEHARLLLWPEDQVPWLPCAGLVNQERSRRGSTVTLPGRRVVEVAAVARTATSTLVRSQVGRLCGGGMYLMYASARG